MQKSTSESVIPPDRLLLTGHFHEAFGYHKRRPRGSDDWLLILTVGGEGRFGYRGGTARALPGDITLMTPGTLHDYGVAAGSAAWELLWAHFHPRPHWQDWLAWPEVAPGLMQLHLGGTAEYANTEGCIRRAVQLGQSPSKLSELLAMTALEETLLWCHAANPLFSEERRDSRVEAAMEYIRRHLSKPITLPEIAEACGLSAGRLGRLFREQTGRTPQQYVEQERMAAARQLLDLTNRSVGAVALAVGFESAFYFSLRFKRATGMSPTEYRDRLNR